jgi:Flp pilus assembly protein TadD
MKLWLTVLLLLLTISTSFALSLTENIDVYGVGGLYAKTNSMNAQDTVDSVGEQSYVRSMDMGSEEDYFESQYKCTNGTTRNNNSSNYYYVSGDSFIETQHFVSVRYNQSLESLASVARNGNVFVTNYKIKSSNGKLREMLSNKEGPNTIVRAEAKIEGNFSLSSSASEEEERWDGYGLDGIALKMNSVKISGERGVRDRASKIPELILDGGYQITPTEEAANLTREGNRLADSGNYAKALIYFDQALKLDKESKSSAVTWNNKGVALNHLSRYTEAEEAYGQALRRSPNYRIALVNSAANQLSLNKTDEALSTLNRAIENYPDYGEAWYQKGRVLIEFGKYGDALDAFNESTRLDGNNAEAWYSRGDLLYVLATTKYGNSPIMLREAKKSLNKSVVINPAFEPDVIEYIKNKITPKLGGGADTSIVTEPLITPVTEPNEIDPPKPSPYGDF